MKVFIMAMCLVLWQLQIVHLFAVETDDNTRKTSLHFDFKTENGQQREEDVRYDEHKTVSTNSLKKANDPDEVTMKTLEIRGGYSFISADGYEYTVKYKANKNGFQPYVTARKLKNPPALS